MQHRHLNHEQFTLAAIDDVIARGRWQDWVELRRAALADRGVLVKVERICKAHRDERTAQRYHFWHHYVQARLARSQAGEAA